MKHFYTQLAARKTKADALATTQRAMLRGQLTSPAAGQGSQSLTHPRYWAPFILVGEPR